MFNSSKIITTWAKLGVFKPKNILSLSILHKSGDPICFSQAVKCSYWCQAIAKGFDAFLENDTWELIPHNPAMNVVGCRWIYKIKSKCDRSIEHYKAVLWLLGITSWQVLITTKPLALSLNHPLFSVCCPLLFHANAFLHAFLNEEVYMKQPPGFVPYIFLVMSII